MPNRSRPANVSSTLGLPGRNHAPGSSARTIRRLAIRPRIHRQRRVRAQLQLLSTIGTVITELVSIPALIVSLVTLKTSEKHKIESDLASQRTFAQRLTLHGQARSSSLAFGEPVTIGNNTIAPEGYDPESSTTL
ncbi:hypothetical protein [Nonomuraea rubra]|uniref:Uncharacterized protein n=1 Tax=Nonomuraea rubra TaxID=46180 RepID=A0A7X0NXR4_9ACTN|nr:hypothetical protein [Nonomuraea rubra]MBB6551316.1 hypothetical protein [Nonomuraea rubra]